MGGRGALQVQQEQTMIGIQDVQQPTTLKKRIHRLHTIHPFHRSVTYSACTYIQVIDDRYLHEHTNIQTNIIFNQHSYIFESTKASDEYIHFYLGKEGRNGKQIGS